MADLFAPEWMTSFQDVWNNEAGLSDELAKIGFSSTIAYGYLGEDAPRGVLVVENGKAVSAGAFEGQELSWDIRASQDNWTKWMSKPPGMMGLGIAYTSRKMQFLVGDYGAMVKDPRMAGPFVKSFAAMGKA
ncbi:SCP-2 sterol transfer family protein [Magnetovibrio blakemorei]|uniref:SCP-2 sterol transfer family protein n=1 Tax=Magnetovibrio blakemorei TaxID=28181 RepID=A0A1E5Q8Y4_9PROT|nr:SCP-2 sterol transfer family protein [Magnetovibrio blakemorei]OEJ67926.1 SCP-2 sterol transfer family protein [Magnetovibrio blakemorei]